MRDIGQDRFAALFFIATGRAESGIVNAGVVLRRRVERLSHRRQPVHQGKDT